MFAGSAMKLLTSFENPFINPLQTPYSGDFDSDTAYRKPHVVLKIVPEADYDAYTGENQPIPVAKNQRRKSTSGKKAGQKF